MDANLCFVCWARYLTFFKQKWMWNILLSIFPSYLEIIYVFPKNIFWWILIVGMPATNEITSYMLILDCRDACNQLNHIIYVSFLCFERVLPEFCIFWLVVCSLTFAGDWHVSLKRWYLSWASRSGWKLHENEISKDFGCSQLQEEIQLCFSRKVKIQLLDNGDLQHNSKCRNLRICPFERNKVVKKGCKYMGESGCSYWFCLQSHYVLYIHKVNSRPVSSRQQSCNSLAAIKKLHTFSILRKEALLTIYFRPRDHT
jgi:hypothetical protein